MLAVVPLRYYHVKVRNFFIFSKVFYIFLCLSRKNSIFAKRNKELMSFLEKRTVTSRPKALHRLLMAVIAIMTFCGLTALTACSEREDDLVIVQPSAQYSAEVWQYLNKANERENLDEVGRRGYEAKSWRLEVKNDSVDMPEHFRWCGGDFWQTDASSELPELDYVPTRKGLDDLCLSGSGRFSDKQLTALTEWVNEKAPGRKRVIIDLRKEAHGFVNGHHMSWYGYINWSNIGKRREQIISEEEQLLRSIQGTTIVAGTISSSNNYVMTDSTWILVKADSALTEREVVERAGWEYRRVTVLDHVFPADFIIDEFIDCYRSLPQDAWVHIHCQAGRGRTTMFMCLFDMMRNPDVPMKDIFYRQCQLGGTSMYYQGTRPNEQPWRVSLFTETSYLTPLLYDYVQANYQNGFTTTWSEWKRKTFGK